MNRVDLERLATQFVEKTVKAGRGDNIWIEYHGPKAHILAEACEKKAREAGAIPFMIDTGADVINSTVVPLDDAGMEALGRERLGKMKTMQCYIRVNDNEDQEKIKLTPEQMRVYSKALKPMQDYRVDNTRWLPVTAPTEEFAKACGMTLEAFEPFYCDVCTLNYKNMGDAVKPLAQLMTEGKKVRIYSPKQETDLTFSIEGLGATPCTGEKNIPDGECFTSPVKTSVNGTIKFGMSSYKGQKFQSIKLTFENGKVVKAEAENAERTAMLNKMLDVDEGARYVGEFSLNFNPLIKHPTGSILFDEKIDGGIHLALGRSYKDASYNGNESANHWDMVQIHRPDYGGGEIYIDDRLIRKDGMFVVPELLPLNPENLLAASRKGEMDGRAA